RRLYVGQEPSQPRPHLLRHLGPRDGGSERAGFPIRRQVGAAGLAAHEVALELGRELGRHHAVDGIVPYLDGLATGHARRPRWRVSCSRSAIRARCSRVFTAETVSPTICATSSLDSPSTSRSTSTAR